MSWVAEPDGTAFPSFEQVTGLWRARCPDLSHRAGWIYQQLLKLGAGSYIPELSDQYLAVDADVVFVRGVSFEIEAARFPYSRSTEYHEPYRQAFRRLLGYDLPSGHSFVAHHMVFDRLLLAELVQAIEERHDQPWHSAFVDAADCAENASISEWELYGGWVLAKHPELAAHSQLHWRDVTVTPTLAGRGILGQDYDFVAVHTWGRKHRWRRHYGAFMHVGGEVKHLLRRAFRPGPSS